MPVKRAFHVVAILLWFFQNNSYISWLCFHHLLVQLVVLFFSLLHMPHKAATRLFYLASMLPGAKPCSIKILFAFCLCSPCSSILPFFIVPPHASSDLSFFARSLRSISFSSIPSTIV